MKVRARNSDELRADDFHSFSLSRDSYKNHKFDDISATQNFIILVSAIQRDHRVCTHDSSGNSNFRDQMRENEGPADLIRSVYISLKNELYNCTCSCGQLESTKASAMVFTV